MSEQRNGDKPREADERDHMRRMDALMKAFKSNDASSLEVCNFARDIDFGLVAELLECGPSPCGHSSQYTYTEDGGQHITCLLCERSARSGTAPTPSLDAAGNPKLEPTLLERIAIEALNEVKAWRDSDGNEPFPLDTRMKVDAVLMTYEQRRIQRPMSLPTQIKINGVPHQWGAENITYEDVMKLLGKDPKRIYSMTYCTRRSGDEQRQGIMHPGSKPVRVEEGMLFDAGDTSNA